MLIETQAQGFFDRSLRENAFKLEMGVEGSGGQGEGRDRTPFVGCELIVSRGTPQAGITDLASHAPDLRGNIRDRQTEQPICV